MAKKKRSIFLGPILIILIMIVITAIASLVFSLIGSSGQKTSIVGGSLVTTLVSANNLISKAGIKFVFSNVIVNFSLFEPLFLLIISLIGISIGEASGLFKAFFSPLRKIKLSIIIMITLLIGVMGNVLGPSAYALLIPLSAVVYKTIGRNPMLGIITMFLALTIGQAGGMLFNYDAYTLGKATELAAQVSVDPNYTYSIKSNLYIMFGSIFVLVFIGRYIIEKYIVPKVSRWEMPENDKNDEEELVVSKKALYFSHLSFIILLILFIYMIIPGLPGSGILLASEGDNYLARLLSNDASFTSSLPWVITITLMICGGVYGFISKNIKNVYEYNDALERNFKNISYALVLFFFTSQLIGILEWTNMNTIFATKITDFLSTVSMTGLPLIILVFMCIIMVGILIPTATTKWLIMSPIIVPLLMRANIAPNFAQFTFMAADGISKSLTPLFGYFILMIALLQKYNQNRNNKITIFGMLRVMLPAIVLFVIIWLLILSGWYVVGIPLGVNTLPTL